LQRFFADLSILIEGKPVALHTLDIRKRIHD
jgi:hypothetical protein